jgi:hypothetical protein
MSPKILTLEEANSILPIVDAGVRFIRAKAAEIARVQDRLTVLSLLEAQDPRSPEHKDFDAQRGMLEELVEAYNARLEELDRLGCVIKDLRLGLVDFYGKVKGRMVFLCWKLGEKKISFWHDLESGFAERRPISELEEEK